ILIDIGITCKEIETRLFRLGLPISKIRAVFISHEHTDHIKGAKTFIKKYGIPIYFTYATLSNSKVQLDAVNYFTAEKPISIGTLKVTAFEKHHDAAHPHSFIVEHYNTCI